MVYFYYITYFVRFYNPIIIVYHDEPFLEHNETLYDNNIIINLIMYARVP